MRSRIAKYDPKNIIITRNVKVSDLSAHLYNLRRIIPD